MTQRVMIQLGEFQFTITTASYQTFTRDISYRWPSQDVIGKRPALQFVGPSKESIAVAGNIYPGEFGNVEQVDQMRSMAERGEPLRLIASQYAGRGSIMGMWVILAVGEINSFFFEDGSPRKIEFSLEVSYYGDSSTSGNTRIVQTNSPRWSSQHGFFKDSQSAWTDIQSLF